MEMDISVNNAQPYKSVPMLGNYESKIDNESPKTSESEHLAELNLITNKHNLLFHLARASYESGLWDSIFPLHELTVLSTVLQNENTWKEFLNISDSISSHFPSEKLASSVNPVKKTPILRSRGKKAAISARKKSAGHDQENESIELCKEKSADINFKKYLEILQTRVLTVLFDSIIEQFLFYDYCNSSNISLTDSIRKEFGFADSSSNNIPYFTLEDLTDGIESIKGNPETKISIPEFTLNFESNNTYSNTNNSSPTTRGNKQKLQSREIRNLRVDSKPRKWERLELINASEGLKNFIVNLGKVIQQLKHKNFFHAFAINYKPFDQEHSEHPEKQFMDLKTLERNLESLVYIKKTDFAKDFQLLFDTYREYYKDNAELLEQCKELEKNFYKILEKVPDENYESEKENLKDLLCQVFPEVYLKNRDMDILVNGSAISAKPSRRGPTQKFPTVNASKRQDEDKLKRSTDDERSQLSNKTKEDEKISSSRKVNGEKNGSKKLDEKTTKRIDGDRKGFEGNICMENEEDETTRRYWFFKEDPEFHKFKKTILPTNPLEKVQVNKNDLLMPLFRNSYSNFVSWTIPCTAVEYNLNRGFHNGSSSKKIDDSEKLRITKTDYDKNTNNMDSYEESAAKNSSNDEMSCASNEYQNEESNLVCKLMESYYKRNRLFMTRAMNYYANNASVEPGNGTLIESDTLNLSQSHPKDEVTNVQSKSSPNNNNSINQTNSNTDILPKSSTQELSPSSNNFKDVSTSKSLEYIVKTEKEKKTDAALIDTPLQQEKDNVNTDNLCTESEPHSQTETGIENKNYPALNDNSENPKLIPAISNDGTGISKIETETLSTTNATNDNVAKPGETPVNDYKCDVKFSENSKDEVSLISERYRKWDVAPLVIQESDLLEPFDYYSVLELLKQVITIKLIQHEFSHLDESAFLILSDVAAYFIEKIGFYISTFLNRSDDVLESINMAFLEISLNGILDVKNWYIDEILRTNNNLQTTSEETVKKWISEGDYTNQNPSYLNRNISNCGGKLNSNSQDENCDISHSQKNKSSINSENEKVSENYSSNTPNSNENENEQIIVARTFREYFLNQAPLAKHRVDLKPPHDLSFRMTNANLNLGAPRSLHLIPQLHHNLAQHINANQKQQQHQQMLHQKSQLQQQQQQLQQQQQQQQLQIDSKQAFMATTSQVSNNGVSNMNMQGNLGSTNTINSAVNVVNGSVGVMGGAVNVQSGAIGSQGGAINASYSDNNISQINPSLKGIVPKKHIGSPGSNTLAVQQQQMAQQLNSQLNPQQMNVQLSSQQSMNPQQINAQLNSQKMNPQQMNHQQINLQQAPLNIQQMNAQLGSQKINPQQQINIQQPSLNSQQINVQLNTQQQSISQSSTMSNINPQQQQQQQRWNYPTQQQQQQNRVNLPLGANNMQLNGANSNTNIYARQQQQQAGANKFPDSTMIQAHGSDKKKFIYNTPNTVLPQDMMRARQRTQQVPLSMIQKKTTPIMAYGTGKMSANPQQNLINVQQQQPQVIESGINASNTILPVVNAYQQHPQRIPDDLSPRRISEKRKRSVIGEDEIIDEEKTTRRTRRKASHVYDEFTYNDEDDAFDHSLDGETRKKRRKTPSKSKK